MQRNELIQEIFSTFSVMQRLMQTQFHRTFEQLDLSPSQLQLLMIIEHKKTVTLKQLADKMRLTPGAITQVVDPLVRKDLLTRTADDADRRVSNMTLSVKGIEKIAELKKMREVTFSKLLTALDKEELETFLRIQQKMIAYLEDKTHKNTEEKKV